LLAITTSGKMECDIKHDLKKGVSFYIDQKADERTAAIYLLVTFACQRVRIYTHCRCDRRDWNTKTKCVSGGKGKDKISVKMIMKVS